MSGISALKSKRKNLSNKTKVETPKVLVVYFVSKGKIEWPENFNDGVLAMPKMMTLEEWGNADFSQDIELS